MHKRLVGSSLGRGFDSLQVHKIEVCVNNLKEVEMYVFKLIQRIFNQIFPPMSIETNKLLLEEADIIMKEIKEARKLADLLRLKAVLQKFRGAVELAGSPREVKQKLVFLEAQWNRQFRLWKTRGEYDRR